MVNDETGGSVASGDSSSVDAHSRRDRAGVLWLVGLGAAPADERALVTEILRKNRKAAAHFVSANVDAVYGYVRHRLLPRTDLVDDVVQEVFLAALNGLGAFEGTSSLRTWVIAIARHKVDDVYRQLLRAPGPLTADESHAEEPVAEGPSLDELLDTARTRAKARSVLAQMPERYVLMLLWRYWEQRSTRQMAEAIGGTEKSVERTLARARARFKELWLKE
jgi:RNA polymerase sigma-70 factor, ECF subfamily